VDQTVNRIVEQTDVMLVLLTVLVVPFWVKYSNAAIT